MAASFPLLSPWHSFPWHQQIDCLAMLIGADERPLWMDWDEDDIYKWNWVSEHTHLDTRSCPDQVAVGKAEN